MKIHRVAIRAWSAAAAVMALALAGSPDAQAAPWCAAYRNGGTNCGFYTFEQCMAALSGLGGSCNRNYDEPDRPAVRKERKVEPKPKIERAAPVQRPASPPAAPVQPPPAAQPAPAPPVVVQPPAAPAQQPADSFGAARALILSGKYEAGIAAMKSLGYDDHPDVASSIGFANARLGNPSEARAWYDKALAADPNHLGARGYSGALYAAQGDVAKARGDLERIKTICGGTACREYKELEGLITAKGR